MAKTTNIDKIKKQLAKAKKEIAEKKTKAETGNDDGKIDNKKSKAPKYKPKAPAGAVYISKKVDIALEEEEERAEFLASLAEDSDRSIEEVNKLIDEFREQDTTKDRIQFCNNLKNLNRAGIINFARLYNGQDEMVELFTESLESYDEFHDVPGIVRGILDFGMSSTELIGFIKKYLATLEKGKLKKEKVRRDRGDRRIFGKLY